MILKTLWLSLFSLAALFLISKLTGNKQVSQISLFDYIIGITIGNIAAEMATGATENWAEPLAAMTVYGLMSFLISIITLKSAAARNIILGKPLIIYKSGRLYEKNLFKAMLDINEFEMLCRNNGYFNLADLDTIVLEHNGKLSFIPKAAKRPATPEDLNIFPRQEGLTINVIEDGEVLEPNLRYIGKNKFWLYDKLNAQGYKNEKNITLATCDSRGDVSVYKKIPKSETEDSFE